MFSTPITRRAKSRSSVTLNCEALEARQLLSTVVGPVAGGFYNAGVYAPPSPTVSNSTFRSFQVVDASGDDTPSSAFLGGALRVDYSITPPSSTNNAAALARQQGDPTPPPDPEVPPTVRLRQVNIEAWQGTTKRALLGTSWNGIVNWGTPVNLADAPGLAAGTYTIKAVAYFQNGDVRYSPGIDVQLKSVTVVSGDFKGQTFDLSTMTGNSIVVNGRGGTDTLDLKINRDKVATMNGMPLSAFTPTAGGQAIYQGIAVDYVRLTDGREVYFTGIENLKVLAYPDKLAQAFVVGPVVPRAETPQTISLAVTPNDPSFKNQWNLHVTDVPDAWRFNKGSSQVLLVSLDTGALPPAGNTGSAAVGIDTNRLITDGTDDDNTVTDDVNRTPIPGHGHKAISVMIATANDASMITGINWVSQVYVTDVYNGVTLQQAIRDAFAYADARGLKVVFQGGVQGESWYNSGGNENSLKDLFASHANTALFAIAAGNGNVDMAQRTPTDPNNANDPVALGLSGGVARLAQWYDNVLSVGALQRTATTVGGLANAAAVNRASYSNFGAALTMMAPTDSRSTDLFGEANFGGTSCANPNMAAIASLVWSVNPNLSAIQVKSILQRTAMDIGAAGRDNIMGSGLVDGGLAVRRAVALARNFTLANMYQTLPPFAMAAAAAPATTMPAPVATTASKPAWKVVAPGVDAAALAAISLPAGRHELTEVLPALAPSKSDARPVGDSAAVLTRLFADWMNSSDRHDALHDGTGASVAVEGCLDGMSPSI